jgi:hypothetical protein
MGSSNYRCDQGTRSGCKALTALNRCRKHIGFPVHVCGAVITFFCEYLN